MTAAKIRDALHLAVASAIAIGICFQSRGMSESGSLIIFGFVIGAHFLGKRRRSRSDSAITEVASVAVFIYSFGAILGFMDEGPRPWFPQVLCVVIAALFFLILSTSVIIHYQERNSPGDKV